MPLSLGFQPRLVLKGCVSIQTQLMQATYLQAARVLVLEVFALTWVSAPSYPKGSLRCSGGPGISGGETLTSVLCTHTHVLE